MSKPTHVYAFAMDIAAHRFFKIGVSNDPDGRRVVLATACPGELLPFALSPPMSRSDAFGLEWAAHRALHRFRSNNEWFWGCPKVLAAIKIIEGCDPKKSKETMAAWVEEAFRFEHNWRDDLSSRSFVRR